MERYKTFAKMDRIRTFTELNQYREAMGTLQTMDVNRIKKYDDLIIIADVYIRNNRFVEAKSLLERMLKNNASKKVLAKLIYCSINIDNFVDAERYFNEYKRQSASDTNILIYRYKIDKAKKKDYDTLIATLEKLKDIEYIEEWAYELAKCYHKAGYMDKCISECDRIIMWFSEGTIVEKAKLLKDYHTKGIIIKKPTSNGEYKKVDNDNNEIDVIDNENNRKIEDFSATAKLDEITVQIKKAKEAGESLNDKDAALDMILSDEKIHKYKNNKAYDNMAKEMLGEPEVEEEVIEECKTEIVSEKEVEDLELISVKESKKINSDNIELDGRLDDILKENMDELDELSDRLDIFFTDSKETDDGIDLVSTDEVVSELNISEKKIKKAKEIVSEVKDKVDEVEEAATEIATEIATETAEDTDIIEDIIEDKIEEKDETEADSEETTDEVDETEADTEETTDKVDKTEADTEETTDEVNTTEVSTDDITKEVESIDNSFSNILSALSNSVSQIVDDVIEEYKDRKDDVQVNQDEKSVSKENSGNNKDIDGEIKDSADNSYTEVEYTATFDKLAKANMDYIEIDPDIFCNYYDIEILNYSIRKSIYNLQTNMLHANFIIEGPSLSGRTTLARMIARQLFNTGYIKTNRIARINGEIFNKVDLKEKAAKLLDGCMIIQRAENINRKAFDSLMELVASNPGRIIVFLETESAERLFETNGDLKEFFGSRIEMPEYTIDDLVEFAHSYAAAEEFFISEGAESLIRKMLVSKLKNTDLKSRDFEEIIYIIDYAIDKIDSRELYDTDEDDEAKVIEKRDVISYIH